MTDISDSKHARYWKSRRAEERAMKYHRSLENLLYQVLVQGAEPDDRWTQDIRADLVRVEAALEVLGGLN